jgi:hypothetical protein
MLIFFGDSRPLTGKYWTMFGAFHAGAVMLSIEKELYLDY